MGVDVVTVKDYYSYNVLWEFVNTPGGQQVRHTPYKHVCLCSTLLDRLNMHTTSLT